ncbi:MAG: M3 family metallopeptidase [Burkholderiaceae bacterium]
MNAPVLRPEIAALLAVEQPPRYDGLTPDNCSAAIDQFIAAARKTLEEVVTDQTPDTWAAVMAPLTSATEQLSRTWSAVHHLNGVMDSPEWRELTNSKLEAVTSFWSDVAQDERLFAKMKRVAGSSDVKGHAAREQALAHALRDFKLGGAELPADQKPVFAKQSTRLAQLSQKFSEQLLDSTNASVVTITDESRLDGLPEHVVAAAKAEADKRGVAGYVLTLQQPSLVPCLQFAKDRALREELYGLQARRASELAAEGPGHDNTPVMGEILALRQRQARLLRFDSSAELSLASKMADSPQQVIDFLQDLAKRARPSAEQDLAELRAFAAKELGIADLQPWDVSYASEQLRQARYNFSEDEVRQYFQLPNVLTGLFGLVKRLFGVQIQPAAEKAKTAIWHPDVQLFAVYRDDRCIGHLFLDLYARSTKRGGAWMDDSRGRRISGSTLQTPVALLTCNFAAPTSDSPTTLSHDDVITLFHEFGHGLHHLLTEVDELEVSGINGVEWDAVELPSQFMENFCWEWANLQAMTAHTKTGESLPRDLYDKMVAARNFQSGLFMLRQIEFSLFDILIHQSTADLADIDTEDAAAVLAAGQRIMQILNTVRDEVAVIKPPAFNRFAQSFSHIFAGGYAAGYYSYKWAEVLSADAYAAFEEVGEQAYDQVGARFLAEILSRGGSRPAMASFKAFRGREPSIEPLLRHNGLTQAAA